MAESKVLKIEKDYLVQMIQGSKRATIKKGKQDFEPGNEIILETPDGKSKAEATVTEVAYKLYKDLTWQDALDDGFGNVEDLKSVLEGIYGDIENDSIVTIVRF